MLGGQSVEGVISCCSSRRAGRSSSLEITLPGHFLVLHTALQCKIPCIAHNTAVLSTLPCTLYYSAQYTAQYTTTLLNNILHTLYCSAQYTAVHTTTFLKNVLHTLYSGAHYTALHTTSLLDNTLHTHY